MVDLKGQYSRIKSEIDAAIQDVINQAQFIKGKQITDFEQNLAAFLKVKHVITCANGTDALQISMMALGLQPEDEIIIPVFTYAATAEVAALLGLKPVFVDVCPDSFNIDTTQIEKYISVRTKAIVPVHLFGQCANMDEVLRIANKYNLAVIEDTAQAIGAVYTFHNGEKKSAGCMGNVGTCSFFPSKNLGCFGDGGALFTNDDDLAIKLRMICNHGQVKQYKHKIIGVNSRLDTLQAAILSVKLKYLKEYEKNRVEAANTYDALLGQNSLISLPQRMQNSTHVFHQYTIKINSKNRDRLKNEMQKRGIPTMIYYPVSLNKQEAFTVFAKKEQFFPVSDNLCENVLSLPMHTELTYYSIEFICSNLLELLDSQ